MQEESKTRKDSSQFDLEALEIMRDEAPTAHGKTALHLKSHIQEPSQKRPS